MSNIIDAIPLPPIYYHSRDTSYWRMDNSGRWIKVNDSNSKTFIAEYGYTKAAYEFGTNSEVDRCLMDVQANQNAAYVGPLAGYDAGVYTMSGNQVLVTDSPRFLVPAAGEWPTLAALFEGMFVDVDLDQRPYFYGWLKCALQSYRERRWKASQLLALAGPVGSGKSLTQNLITAMLGGRSAKPYQYMMGLTQFNAHMVGAEHLMLEDEAESVDIRSRRHFAANIKTILTGRDQNCHPKHKDAVILQPIWRMTLSLNDDPERLQVLPPLDSDVRDKIIILKVNRCEMPMPTDTPELEGRFWRQLTSELPAFLHDLESWDISDEIADCRYGITSFKHPEIVEKLEETAPELKLLELIDRQVFDGGVALAENRTPQRPWEGTAAALEANLVGNASRVTFEARKVLTWANACGTYLGRLVDSENQDLRGRVTNRKVMGKTIWSIQPPSLPVRENPVNAAEEDDLGPPPLPAGLCCAVAA